MPLVTKRAKGTYGFQTVAYRSASGETYNAQITGTAALAAPTGVAVAPQGAAGAVTYGYRVSALGGGGETLAATEVTTATGNATLDATNFNRISWNAVAGASGYVIYRTTGGATQGRIGTKNTTAPLQFDDTGLAASGAVASGNTAVSFSIRVPALRVAGGGAHIKTGIASNSTRTNTNVLVVGR